MRKARIPDSGRTRGRFRPRRRTTSLILGCALFASLGAVTGAPAWAGVGSPALQPDLVSNPIGGAPLPSSFLEPIANAAVRSVSAVYPGAQGAAEGWSNAQMRAEFFNVLVVATGAVGSPAAFARDVVTSGCSSLGGNAGKLQKIRGLDGGEAYQVSCRANGHPSMPPLEIICLVKANTLDTFYAVTSRGFPLRSLDALAIRQSRLIPARGIEVNPDAAALP